MSGFWSHGSLLFPSDQSASDYPAHVGPHFLSFSWSVIRFKNTYRVLTSWQTMHYDPAGLATKIKKVLGLPSFGRDRVSGKRR